MTVVVIGKCICKLVEHNRYCAFDVVHIGKDSALGPDGEEYIHKHGSKSSPFMCLRGNGIFGQTSDTAALGPSLLPLS